MRKIGVFENVSLDGYFCGPNGEIDWFVAPQDASGQRESEEFAVESIRSSDTLLFGRVTYELMASFWPSEDAKKSSSNLAKRMNDQPKIVFSRTLDKVEWQNTRLIKDNIVDEIKKMKDQPGKDMVILGSGSIVSEFAGYGLIDEYRIMVNPVILGKGRSIFQGLKDRVSLKLLGTRTFEKSGNILLNYQVVK